VGPSPVITGTVRRTPEIFEQTENFRYALKNKFVYLVRTAIMSVRTFIMKLQEKFKNISRVVGMHNENLTDEESEICEEIAEEFAIDFFDWIIRVKAPLSFPSDVLLKMYKNQKKL
jgi:hypothetical protein